MERLDNKTISILDKLYNLRGNESTILCAISDDEKRTEDIRDDITSLLGDLNDSLTSLNGEEKILVEEGENLVNALDSVSSDSFSKVVETLNIDFNPELIKNEVERSLPITLNKIRSDIRDTERRIAVSDGDLADALTHLEELSIRKEEAVTNQKKLNDLFKLALKNNINITRDEITSLLVKFDLDDDEQRLAAKLLLFPEDGLLAYNNGSYEKTVTTKSIGEVINEAKETPKFIIEPSEHVVLDDNKEEDLVNIVETPEFDFNSLNKIEEEEIVVPQEEVKEEVYQVPSFKEVVKEDIAHKEQEEQVNNIIANDVVGIVTPEVNNVVETSEVNNIVNEPVINQDLVTEPIIQETLVNQNNVVEPVVNQPVESFESVFGSSNNNVSNVQTGDGVNNTTVDKLVSSLENIISNTANNMPVVEENKPLTEVEEHFKEEQKDDDYVRESITKDELINKLNGFGFDYLDFTNNDFNKMLDNYDSVIFTKNINLLNNMGLAKDIFNDNVELIYDKDLEAKIDVLLNIGKKPQDIYLNPNVLIKYNLGELDDAIKTLHDSGLDPRTVPLMAY